MCFPAIERIIKRCWEKNTKRGYTEMNVDPVMAMIAAALATVAGIALFVRRRLAEKE